MPGHFLLRMPLDVSIQKKHTEVSLMVDAMINILDDLFDKQMNKQKKDVHYRIFTGFFSV